MSLSCYRLIHPVEMDHIALAQADPIFQIVENVPGDLRSLRYFFLCYKIISVSKIILVDLLVYLLVISVSDIY